MAWRQNCIFYILLLGYHGSLVVHGYKCYQNTCFEKGCMDNIKTQPNGIQCDNLNYGCMIMKMFSMENETETTMWSAVCSPSACVSGSSLTESSETIIHCCSSDLCNAELPTVQAGSNQCYAVSCTSDDCVEKAIADNKVSSCPIGEFGCSLVKIKTGNDTQVVASCSTSECKTGYVELPGIETKAECCNTDLCNHKFSGNLPSENVCYQLACTGENCVKNAVAEKKTGSCPMSSNGCSITYIKNMTTGEVTGAAGCLQKDTPCSAGAILTDESEIYVQCCTSDLCNTELKSTDTGKKCYSVRCSGTGCLDKTINDGKSVTCKMDERYGCAHMRTTTGSITSEQSMCMPQQCAEGTSKHGKDLIEISCCGENLCNAAYTSAGVSVKCSFSFFTLFAISYIVVATLLE